MSWAIRRIVYGCARQLPTAAGRAFIGEPVESPPYPSAKPHFVIEDHIDDRRWLAELVRVTEREIPLPKPKKRKPA